MIGYRSNIVSGKNEEKELVKSCNVYFGGKSGKLRACNINNAIFNAPVIIGNNITACDYMFYNCYNFNQPIIIPENVKDCSYMFSGCNNFNQSVVIPENVTNCYSMFENCTRLSSNIYIKSKNRDINTVYLLLNKNNSLMINVHCYPEIYDILSANGYYNTSVFYPIEWTPMQNGCYNTTYNVYIYNNYTG